MNAFPETSVTLIAKIKDLAPGDDSAAWVRFWDSYQGAIRHLAALRGGEENADDITLQVLAKLVTVLRSGQYTPQKGRFHSYLATMVINEVHMAHRKEVARAVDRRVSIDAPLTDTASENPVTIADTLVAPETPEQIDADWRAAILKSAVDFVLTRTALTARDREVYRAFALEGGDIGAVARQYGISRNMVSQIKTRINKRIVDVGRELLARQNEI